MGLGGISPIQLLIVILLCVAIFVLPYWQIFKKAGYSRWLSLLMLIPLVNLGLLYFLAFAPWPSASQSANGRGSPMSAA